MRYFIILVKSLFAAKLSLLLVNKLELSDFEVNMVTDNTRRVLRLNAREIKLIQWIVLIAFHNGQIPWNYFAANVILMK